MGSIRRFAGLANETLMRELRRELRYCCSMLDVGCGRESPVRNISIRKIGLDADLNSLLEARRHGTHDQYLLANARDVGRMFRERTFDATVALDVIEHLPKEESYRLLQAFTEISKRKVIIFTPNGFLPQQGDENKFQAHHSGWTTDDLLDLGYRVIGIGGPKWLRGQYHVLNRKPRWFWAPLSFTLHLLRTRSHPREAAALLGVKDVFYAG